MARVSSASAKPQRASEIQGPRYLRSAGAASSINRSPSKYSQSSLKDPPRHIIPQAVAPVRRKRMAWNRLGNSASRIRFRAGTGHAYSQQTASANSKHSEWYRDMIPGMIPIVLLGSTVYLVRRPVVAASMERTTDVAHRASNLRAQSSHTRNKCLKPRNVFLNSKRISSILNHK